MKSPKKKPVKDDGSGTPHPREQARRRRALFGCVQQRPLWAPTWRGWLVAILLLFGVGFIFVKTLPGFLSAHHPIQADILVVEGWIPDYALEAAISEFNRGSYTRLYVTGGPLEKGLPLSQFKTYADLGASMLVGLGMDKERIQAVPAPEVRADRTYNSARALRNFFQQELPPSKKSECSFHWPSFAAHPAILHKAFADDWEIGVISVPDKSYDVERWYRASNGVRNVLSETIAFVYAKVFFHPPKPDRSKRTAYHRLLPREDSQTG